MANEDINGAINYLKTYRKIDEKTHNMSPKDSVAYFATNKCLKYWDMAIQALEQGDVLREIRQEIAEFRNDAEIRYGHQLGFDKIYAYERCIDLIDSKIKELSE